MKKAIQILSFLTSTMILVSCGGNKKETTPMEVTTEETSQEEVVEETSIESKIGKKSLLMSTNLMKMVLRHI